MRNRGNIYSSGRSKGRAEKGQIQITVRKHVFFVNLQSIHSLVTFDELMSAAFEEGAFFGCRPSWFADLVECGCHMFALPTTREKSFE